jgi:hypothetical protein
MTILLCWVHPYSQSRAGLLRFDCRRECLLSRSIRFGQVQISVGLAEFACLEGCRVRSAGARQAAGWALHEILKMQCL